MSSSELSSTALVETITPTSDFFEKTYWIYTFNKYCNGKLFLKLSYFMSKTGNGRFSPFTDVSQQFYCNSDLYFMKQICSYTMQFFRTP